MFIGNYYKRSKNHSLFTTLILNLTNTTSKSCLNQLEGNGCEMADSYIPMPEYSDCEATQVRSRCKDVLSKKTLRIHVFTKKYIAALTLLKPSHIHSSTFQPSNYLTQSITMLLQILLCMFSKKLFVFLQNIGYGRL